jgi:hypothetical protein
MKEQTSLGRAQLRRALFRNIIRIDVGDDLGGRDPGMYGRGE